jgi:pimeloyl-ACP methyl ester carboxylesterase
VLGPGTWVYGSSLALGRRVLASNKAANVFHRGFVACDSYANGEEAMAAVSCPVLMLLGAQDQMTPPKAAQTLLARAQACGKACKVIALPVGHHQMSEAPDATLQAIRGFLQP